MPTPRKWLVKVSFSAPGRCGIIGNPSDEALSDRVMADVFRVSAYRSEYRREAVIVPWDGNPGAPA